RLSMLPLSPRSTLFPYTTLFRSVMVSTIHAVILLNERQCVGVVRGFDPVPRKVVFKLLDLSLELGGVAVARDRIGTVCRYQNVRAEEHTSELQSGENLVYRLLRE